MSVSFDIELEPILKVILCIFGNGGSDCRLETKEEKATVNARDSYKTGVNQIYLELLLNNCMFDYIWPSADLDIKLLTSGTFMGALY